MRLLYPSNLLWMLAVSLSCAATTRAFTPPMAVPPAARTIASSRTTSSSSSSTPFLLPFFMAPPVKKDNEAQEELTVDDIALDAEERMEKSVDSVRTMLTSIRTGRASASMLDRVKADYYGVETPISQMASISIPSAQQITVDPWDKKMCGEIEKAIMESDLGLTPTNDGSLIRINIPQLTQDRRKEMLKQCKAIGEEGKVAVRNIRRDGVDAVKKLQKKGTIGEDNFKDGQDVMQKLTDAKVKEIDDIVAKKEKEVMTV